MHANSGGYSIVDVMLENSVRTLKKREKLLFSRTLSNLVLDELAKV